MKPLTFPDTPGWDFYIDEVSANVFRLKARDKYGRSIEITGTDPDALIDEARQTIKKIIADGGD